MISLNTDLNVDHHLMRLLGDPLRAKIVAHLAVEQLCTCHLVELTGATQTNVSNHLRALKLAGVVTSEPCGRFTYYRLEVAALDHLSDQVLALRDGAQTALSRRRPCP